ncbi:MAG TPA: hypothetical protein VD926_05360 [Acidimicrobiales bacterium]|nr:hypothetical protein [Acidimicrobiales bacterium]
MPTVTDPSGRSWTVHRRWHLRDRDRERRAWARESLRDAWDWLEGLDALAEVPAIGIIAGIAAVVVVLVLVFIPIVILVGELLVLVSVVAGTLVARVVFRRPWTIEAKASDGEVRRWEVVGWRASGDHVRFVREQLEHGMPLPPEGLASGP